VISQYNYSVNNIGQRSAVSQTGTAFSSARSIAWGYDPLGQVIAADSSINTADRTYQYDAQSRRIAKTTGTNKSVFLYNAWNCIADYSLSSNQYILSHTRLWGTDLSGSMQGAGGVGGLLLITDHSALITSHYPTYDGNGNVSEYLTATGSVAAHFEYDPFGNTVVNTDTAGQFAYKFSTKPVDPETGLYYYGYRYYDPFTGRWPSRDPIEEDGGINLYAMVCNDPVNRWDYLGLIDPSLTLTYKTISQPTTGDCGAMHNWVVLWILSKATPRGGQIFQKLDVKLKVKDCKGKKITHPADDGHWNYSEAWDVNPNQSVTSYAQNGDPNDDTYSTAGAGDCTEGIVIMKGRARFYEDITLPTSFQPNNPSTYAGILPAATPYPHLNPDTATPSEHHEIKIEWNCCGTDKSTKVTMK
jgi:RHS repeat-associated protein